MARDIDLEFCVQFSPEQVELAWQMVCASASAPYTLKKTESRDLDWVATAKWLSAISAHVYVTFLLIQARREQRRILNCSSDLVRDRKSVLTTMTMLGGKQPTEDDILRAIAARVGVQAAALKPLRDPIRRDLKRLAGLTTKSRRWPAGDLNLY